MKQVGKECYAGIGDTIAARAEVLEQELGIQALISVGARLEQLAENGVPVYQVDIKVGTIGNTGGVHEGATDYIAFQYNWEGESITEVWEGYAEYVEQTKGTYLYLIAHIATLKSTSAVHYHEVDEDTPLEEFAANYLD